jgi:DNA-binding response OmpR family regulator
MATGKLILIVEDDRGMRTQLKDGFTRAGFRTLEAADGEEAVALAANAHPDLILLDIVLPKLNGLAAAERIRKTERGKDVPIIMLTSLQDIYTIEAATTREIFEFLVKKDWTIEEVVAKVRAKFANV